MARKENI